jgi:hypothetical protein
MAKNPLLPEHLQRLLVRRAGDWIRTHPGEVIQGGDPVQIADRIARLRDGPPGTLDTLLQSDTLAANTMIDTLALILSIGIRPADGSFQNSFFHLRCLPAVVIQTLDQRLRHSSDWALTLMLQEHATRTQLSRALARWYDDDSELQATLAATTSMSDEDFWLALAQSSSSRLREAALHPHSTPAAVQWLIDHPDPALGMQAALHPLAPREVKLAALSQLSAFDLERATLTPDDLWEEVAQVAPHRDQRRAAYARAAAAKLERFDQSGH